MLSLCELSLCLISFPAEPHYSGKKNVPAYGGRSDTHTGRVTWMPFFSYPLSPIVSLSLSFISVCVFSTPSLCGLAHFYLPLHTKKRKRIHNDDQIVFTGAAGKVSSHRAHLTGAYYVQLLLFSSSSYLLKGGGKTYVNNPHCWP